MNQIPSKYMNFSSYLQVVGGEYLTLTDQIAAANIKTFFLLHKKHS
ncbi:hypothetical protein MRBL20_002601 [Peribacillus frigoritolerans]